MKEKNKWFLAPESLWYKVLQMCLPIYVLKFDKKKLELENFNVKFSKLQSFMI